MPELHLYGINLDKDIKYLETENPNIKVKGFMKDINSLSKYRVCLCPVVYGAGIKGKITDSWRNEVPVITSLYGAESLMNKVFSFEREKKINFDFNYKNIIYQYEKFMEINKENFGGFISNDIDELANFSYKLYSDEKIWNEKLINSKNYFKFYSEEESIQIDFGKNDMGFEHNFNKLKNLIIREDLDEKYDKNNTNAISLKEIYSKILNDENTSSLKFKSKFIELKNSKEEKNNMINNKSANKSE